MKSNNLIRFLFNTIRDPILYKFMIVGSVAALFTLLFTGIFTSFVGIPVHLSVYIAWELTVIWTFLILDNWAFSNLNKKHSKINRFVRFHLVTVGALLINEIVLTVFLIQTNLHYLVAESFAILAGFLFNYFLNRRFSWVLKSVYT